MEDTIYFNEHYEVLWYRDEHSQLCYSPVRFSAPLLQLLLEVSSICSIEQYGPWLTHETLVSL